jgi:hypothetical protein
MDEVLELQAKRKFISSLVGAKRRGEIFTTTAAKARHLFEADLVELRQKPAGPSERKPIEPAERKEEAAPPLGKSCGASLAGRRIDTRSSSAPGRGIRSLFSVGVPALR